MAKGMALTRNGSQGLRAASDSEDYALKNI
jgi:hypothetical protein